MLLITYSHGELACTPLFPPSGPSIVLLKYALVDYLLVHWILQNTYSLPQAVLTGFLSMVKLYKIQDWLHTFCVLFFLCDSHDSDQLDWVETYQLNSYQSHEFMQESLQENDYTFPLSRNSWCQWCGWLKFYLDDSSWYNNSSAAYI